MAVAVTVAVEQLVGIVAAAAAVGQLVKIAEALKRQLAMLPMIYRPYANFLDRPDACLPAIIGSLTANQRRLIGRRRHTEIKALL